MKKHYFTLLLCLASFSQIYGQAWTDIGIKLGAGTSWLIDKNIFDDNTYTHDFSGAFNVGAKASLNLGQSHSLSFEVMLSKMKQNFDYGFSDAAMMRFEGTNEIEWTNLDLYFLYRYYSQGAYSEFGIMNSRVRNVEHRDAQAGFTDFTDVTSNYQNYLSGVFGGGAFIAGSERFTFMLGLRIHYAFTDFISDQGQDPAALQAQDQAFPFPNTFRRDFSDTNSDPYADARKTSPLLIEMIAEFNFGLGYFAKSVCSGRTKWIGG